MSRRQKNPIVLPAQLRHRLEPLRDPLLSRHGHWFYIKTGLSIAVVIFGTYVSYLEFNPSLTVNYADYLNSNYPFASTPFTITNSGLMPIRNVEFSCTANKVIYRDSVVGENNKMSDSTKTTSIMYRNKSTTVVCPLDSVDSLSASSMISADIELRIAFNGTWPLTDYKFPYASERKFRYCGAFDDSHHARWFQQPLARDCFHDIN